MAALIHLVDAQQGGSASACMGNLSRGWPNPYFRESVSWKGSGSAASGTIASNGSTTRAEAKASNHSGPVAVFFHIGLVGRYREVVPLMVEQMRGSGLLQVCAPRLSVLIVGASTKIPKRSC